MYNIAFVHNDKCIAEKGCRLCIMYCPEADTIMLDQKTMKAVVIVERCKGCDLCKVVCSTHHAITMHPVDPVNGKIILGEAEKEAAGLGQAYQG
ncbi:MAG: 4Fe-4S dicluster-binding protein [Nitrospinaceae bacterium]